MVTGQSIVPVQDNLHVFSTLHCMQNPIVPATTRHRNAVIRNAVKNPVNSAINATKNGIIVIPR